MASSSIPRPYPLYNTTFALHRLSPLYTGLPTPLSNSNLKQYTRPLRDILAGDVLRGVRVGLGADEDILARVGALKGVTWRILPSEDLWNAGPKGEEDVDMDVDMDTTMGSSEGRGILVDVEYERATYTAALLADEGEEGRIDGEGFQRFPLLLTRMPGSLRETFLEFLVATFDVRVSVLRLGRAYMTSALERCISDCAIGEDGEQLDVLEASRVLRSVIKDVQIVVGYDLPGGSASLKSIEIVIAREDLPRIVQAGRKIERKEGTQESPFMAALTSYIDAHLALNLRHERVKILKLACGAFVLGADGRGKFTEPMILEGDNVQSRATWTLVNSLVKLAKGGALSKLDGK